MMLNEFLKSLKYVCMSLLEFVLFSLTALSCLSSFGLIVLLLGGYSGIPWFIIISPLGIILFGALLDTIDPEEYYE